LSLVDLGAAGLLLLGRQRASAFSSSVTRPLLPRKRALAFSSSAGVGAASNSAVRR
jgi:hypothetical protein